MVQTDKTLIERAGLTKEDIATFDSGSSSSEQVRFTGDALITLLLETADAQLAKALWAVVTEYEKWLTEQSKQTDCPKCDLSINDCCGYRLVDNQFRLFLAEDLEAAGMERPAS